MFLTYLCTILLLLTGFLLMFIVLLQRGRGGGLAGAFGGLGGQSAFGTKAGDVFTKITIVLAVIWVALAGVTGFAMKHDADKSAFKSEKKAPKDPEITTPSGKTKTKASPFQGLGPIKPGPNPKPDLKPKPDTKTRKSADNSKTESESVRSKSGKPKSKTPDTKTKKKAGS